MARSRRRGLSVGELKRRHQQAAKISSAVYRAVRDLQDEGVPSPVPISVMAPLTYLGQLVAPSIAQRLGKPEDDALVDDIGAYLTSGYLSMIATFRPEHFAQWREQADQLEHGAAAVLDERPVE